MTDVLYASHIAYDKGVRRGERHGKAEARREMAKGFRDAGVPLDIIAKQSGLSEDEIRAL